MSKPATDLASSRTAEFPQSLPRSMGPLRRNTQESAVPAGHRPLRIIASGTLFLTHTLSLTYYPAPGSVTRARAVARSRGGSASVVLSLLAQFPAIEPMLVAPLGAKDDGELMLRELEKDGVSTRYCKIWPESGAPSAWVMHASDGDTRTVINNNPLPDITHEEFVSLLGPLLAPENYYYPSPSASPTSSVTPAGQSTNPATRAAFPLTQTRLINPDSPAPFDWLHFEGRSVKTTLSNINGLDGLAKERRWRNHCVFSVDVGRKGRQGVEALIPHADVLFVNKHYAETQSPHYESTPRAFLLSLTSLAPPHALLVAHWGREGAAVLSLPTREYFQSSGWVEEDPSPQAPTLQAIIDSTASVRSVRSGSDFWANTRGHTPSSSGYTMGGMTSLEGGMATASVPPSPLNPDHRHRDDEDNDSQGTETPDGRRDDDEIVDELGSQDAFVAGMIFALSRRLLPGPPYTPAQESRGPRGPEKENLKERWRLDECLRFATELAGRKARRRTWDGLADEMARAGWFESGTVPYM